MPSWNIHIAQVERLFARDDAVARTVYDRNAFLLGNLVPDIYVGYMVPAVTHPIAYRITHFATPEPIPKPREREFWDTHVVPWLVAVRALGVDLAGALSGDAGARDGRPCIPASSLDAEQDFVSRTHYPQRYEGAAAPVSQGCPEDDVWDEVGLARSVLDLTLGTWAHLVADNLWNTRVNEFLDAHGGRPSEAFRIKKQADFDGFGKSLAIDALVRPTARLAATAERFVQYPIDERTLLTAIGVAHETVRTNPGGHGHPPYQLLTEAFFDETLDEAIRTTDRLLAERLGVA